MADGVPAPRARSKWARISLLSAAGLVAWSCASAGSPATFRFPTMLEPTTAQACAVRLLRQAGFERSDSTHDAAVAFVRRPPPSLAVREWWRVELSVVTDPEEGGTVVQSVAGAARTAEGPYGPPPSDLQHVVGTIAGRCTW